MDLTLVLQSLDPANLKCKKGILSPVPKSHWEFVHKRIQIRNKSNPINSWNLVGKPSKAATAIEFLHHQDFWDQARWTQNWHIFLCWNDIVDDRGVWSKKPPIIPRKCESDASRVARPGDNIHIKLLVSRAHSLARPFTAGSSRI